MTPIHFELNGDSDGDLSVGFIDGLRDQITESGAQLLDDWYRFHCTCTANRFTREQFMAQLVDRRFELVWISAAKHDWLCIR
jgi:hypothetical protein